MVVYKTVVWLVMDSFPGGFVTVVWLVKESFPGGFVTEVSSCVFT